ncbi:alpha-xylosidase [Oscillospiraceae bacterium HV4-5-C5C]|nr:alpha-xylosidase [Oscillospiraceae bacterium HV4-5-C5C]
MTNPLYQLKTDPQPRPEAVIRGQHYRLTVLTAELIRLEFSRSGSFDDRATQTVLNRRFPLPYFETKKEDGWFRLSTPSLRLSYRMEEPFTAQSLQITVTGHMPGQQGVWFYGQSVENLGGTARTLDQADGSIPLESGLMSRSGYTVLDDSHTMRLTPQGWVEPRSENAGPDLYFFGYGHNYTACLQAFYQLTGPQPLLPRWTFGNWWSRYYPYTQKGYESLMERFECEKIPLSVAVIDMDWHKVEVPARFGSGWTGYSWNRALFPDPPAFLKWLHQHGLKVTLNVHPAEGVRAYEDAYPQMAKAMGIDPATEEPVAFDAADPNFMTAYFRCLHHPLEQEGVDFWWIDWQQGRVSHMPGLDPLWILNHFHYLDNGRGRSRALTFSRYAGPGSHRYPVGFSGDTIISWASLAFQPYFTATASNIGYGWWSHDIGGHMRGVRDNELTTRWVQLGAFSPILRLHSSRSPFIHKEPWEYPEPYRQIITRYLQLRQRLIPYLYSMNYRAAAKGQPLIQPLYYSEPECPEAYDQPNEYYFGSAFLAGPVTCPCERDLGLAAVRMWLPEGRWYDFFTGMVYDGGRLLTLWRPLQYFPLLLRAGSLVPLGPQDCSAEQNPDQLELHLFPGADGRFTLWEDQGEGQSVACTDWAASTFDLSWGAQPCLKITAGQGLLTCLPDLRYYKVVCHAVMEPASLYLKLDGQVVQPGTTHYDADRGLLEISLPPLRPAQVLTLSFNQGLVCRSNPIQDFAYQCLDQAELDYEMKEAAGRIIRQQGTRSLASLAASGLPGTLLSALTEILSAEQPKGETYAYSSSCGE